MHHSTAPGTSSVSLEALELCLPSAWGENAFPLEQQPSYLNRGTLDSGQERWQCVPRGFPGAIGINANICPGPGLSLPFLLGLLMGNEPLEMRKGEGAYCQSCEFLSSEPEYEARFEICTYPGFLPLKILFFLPLLKWDTNYY